MCGLTGFLDFRGMFSAAEMGTTIQRMTDTLLHRGPDDHGIWLDGESGVALGHRRLSILDLSSE